MSSQAHASRRTDTASKTQQSLATPFIPWSSQGRLNRLQYFVLTFGLPALSFFAIVILSPTIRSQSFDASGGVELRAFLFFSFTVAWVLAIMAIQIMWTARRCQDLGRSPWYCAFWFVPLVNLLFWVLPGTEGDNRYGVQPLSSNMLRGVAITLAAVYAATCTSVFLIGESYYDNRVARQQVAQCLKSSRYARKAISHFIQDADRFVDRKFAKSLFNEHGLDNKYCTQTIDIEQRIIIAQFKSDASLSPLIRSGTVVFIQQPERIDDHQHGMLFRCISDDIDYRHLPSSCAL